MKLPTSIFPNITEYLRANWEGYLNPRDITIDYHTELDDITWNMVDSGTIHIHIPTTTKANLSGAIVGWKIQAPSNTKVVLKCEHCRNIKDFVEHGTVFDGISMTRKLLSENCVIYVSDENKWTLTGLTFGWNLNNYCTDIYISLVDGDRLDACLTGDHLKPIAVGDTLGLVYWDGTACNEYEASFNITTSKTSPTGAPYQWLTARDCAEDNGTLTLLNLAGPRETILAQAGTINLAEYNIHINSIQTSGQPCLSEHLWHVI